MYRVVLLPEHQRDMRRFMWREYPQQPLKVYRMMRVTFGVSAFPFAAIMAMRQNALDHRRKYPLSAQAVMDDFYMDDGLYWTDSIDEAVKLRFEMHELFKLGGFVLRKWKSSEPAALAQIPHELVDSQSTNALDIDHFTKVLGMEWNSTSDTF